MLVDPYRAAVPVPISRIWEASQAGSVGDLSLPSHIANDAIILLLRHSDTLQSVPSGWTDITGLSSVPGGNQTRVCWVIDPTGSTYTSISLPNANYTAWAVCYRGVGSVGAPATTSGGGPSTSASFGSLSLADPGDSWVFAALQTGSASSHGDAAGMVKVRDYEPSYGGSPHILYDTDGPAASFTGPSVSWTTSAFWGVVALELLRP